MMLHLSPRRKEGAGHRETWGTGTLGRGHCMHKSPAGGPLLGHWSSSKAARVVSMVVRGKSYIKREGPQRSDPFSNLCPCR